MITTVASGTAAIMRLRGAFLADLAHLGLDGGIAFILAVFFLDLLLGHAVALHEAHALQEIIERPRSRASAASAAISTLNSRWPMSPTTPTGDWPRMASSMPRSGQSWVQIATPTMAILSRPLTRFIQPSRPNMRLKPGHERQLGEIRHDLVEVKAGRGSAAHGRRARPAIITREERRQHQREHAISSAAHHGDQARAIHAHLVRAAR